MITADKETGQKLNRIQRNTYLRYNNVCHGFRQRVKVLSLIEAQNFHVVLQVVLDAVVDVGNLADVVDVGIQPEIFDEFAPATLHQFPRLAVVQRNLCRPHTADVHQLQFSL